MRIHEDREEIRSFEEDGKDRHAFVEKMTLLIDDILFHTPSILPLSSELHKEDTARKGCCSSSKLQAAIDIGVVERKRARGRACSLSADAEPRQYPTATATTDRKSYSHS